MPKKIVKKTMKKPVNKIKKMRKDVEALNIKCKFPPPSVYSKTNETVKEIAKKKMRDITPYFFVILISLVIFGGLLLLIKTQMNKTDDVTSSPPPFVEERPSSRLNFNLDEVTSTLKKGIEPVLWEAVFNENHAIPANRIRLLAFSNEIWSLFINNEFVGNFTKTNRDEPVIEIREISAYNVGDPEQTDDTPCIGASGIDLCQLIAQGTPVCAANFVPFGTFLKIGGLGDCVVLDRMNERYPERVDLALPVDQKEMAQEFGVQNLPVSIN